MKRLFGLGVVVALLLAGLFLAQKRRPHAEASPDAVLHFIGDTEQELSRLPMTATRLTDAEEMKIGNELAQRYKYSEQLRDDTPENQQFRHYLQKVGLAVSGHAQRKLIYQFHYVPDPNMVNAFAIPGGHVYIGKGLLDLMDSEDELAAVLGHEIEHIDRRHAVERLQRELALRHLGLARLLLELPIEVFAAGYSKEQELEADREGTRLSVIAGYSPTGAIRMFESFDRRFQQAREDQAKSPQEEAARVVLTSLSEYFRSHPPTQERIWQIQNLITQEGWPARQEKPFALAYLIWSDRAKLALQQHKYKEASAFASRSLDLKPDFESALRAQGEAEFYQANFARAAQSYRELLNIQPSNLGYIQYYAFLLASADQHSAAETFSRLLQRSNNSYPVLDSLAGLQLLSGRPEAADKIYASLKADPSDDRSPDRLAWLGWWYYISGNPQRAFEMLESTTQQRPNNVVYLVNFAWTAVELRRYQQALMLLTSAERQLPRLNSFPSYPPPKMASPEDVHAVSEIQMAEAVANWLAKSNDAAISLYHQATAVEPAWKNAAWFGPQYSPTVSRAINEMKGESDRRRRAAEEEARRAKLSRSQ